MASTPHLCLLGLIALLGACDTSTAPGGGAGSDETGDDTGAAEVSREWTGRQYEGRGLAWASHRDLSTEEYGALFSEYQERGWIIVDVDARSEGDGAVYSMVWHENPDGRGWAQHRNMSAAEYDRYQEMYFTLGWRPLDVEAYLLGGEQRYAGIWIENVEGLRWSSRRDQTSSEYGDYFDEMRSGGFTPIDIEGHTNELGELRFSGIWVEDVEQRPIVHLRNLSRSEYQANVDELAAAGYALVDYESYRHDGAQYYAAIWEQPSQQRVTAVATDRSWLDYTNTWRANADDGYRLADQELYDGADGPLYGGVWVGNEERLGYEHAAAIDELVQAYRDGAFPDRHGAVSVAVYHGGELVYVGGTGEADRDAGLIAHGSTVYRLASVSKVVGGTLAALLESQAALQDGTPYQLDLAQPTASFLPDIPDHHTHTAEQLASHLGCVAHYGTTPAIEEQSNHYATATAASMSIWDTGLAGVEIEDTEEIRVCVVGDDRVYSSPAFTFLGAVLESATGRTIDALLDDELAAPHGLATLQTQWKEPTLPDNPLRAVSYSFSGAASDEEDTSWKVLGGGLEADVYDLARFGQLVLDGEIVDAETRDDRMWSPVAPGCAAGDEEAVCRNGLGWELYTLSGRRTAEHGGYQPSGARSYLRLYRDDALVVAVLSNRAGYISGSYYYYHSPSRLIDDIAEVILEP